MTTFVTARAQGVRVPPETMRRGLEWVARLVGLLPSNYNHMEKGRTPPPQDRARLDQISEVLGLGAGTGEYADLFDLAVAGKDKLPADVADFAKNNEMVPVLLRTLANRKLSKSQFSDLVSKLNKDISSPRKASADGVPEHSEL